MESHQKSLKGFVKKSQRNMKELLRSCGVLNSWTAGKNNGEKPWMNILKEYYKHSMGIPWKNSGKRAPEKNPAGKFIKVRWGKCFQ